MSPEGFSNFRGLLCYVGEICLRIHGIVRNGEVESYGDVIYDEDVPPLSLEIFSL